MKHLDLFSGIGGFALATEMVWDNVEHIFCDNEPFAQAILSKHWPNSPIYGDIRTLTANSYIERYLHGELKEQSAERSHQTFSEFVSSPGTPTLSIDLLTGGFPCQPFSQAGRRRGTEDDRHLWPEMLRVIREFHPQWVIGENVGGLVTWSEGLVLEQIHADLEGEGYEVQAFIIPAVAVNAPHRRDRVWIVGNSNSDKFDREKSRGFAEESRQAESNGQNDNTTRESSGTDEQLSENRKSHGHELDATDTASERQQGQGEYSRPSDSEKNQDRETNTTSGHSPSWDENWVEVATRLCRVDDGISRRLDRNLRLKGLGNAIVPQVAAEIMKVIKQIDS